MVKRIGLLVVDIESTYNTMIWTHLSEAIKGSEYDLLILPFQNPEFPFGYLKQNNVLLNFIDKKNIDVLIFIPSVLGNFITKEQYQALIERIKQAVPVISINTLIDNSPSLIINSTEGIKEAIKHLILDHHYKKIAFMCGPEDNIEAIERKNAYIQEMQAHNLSPSKEYFLPGDFTPDTAQILAKTQGSKIVADFDAILCANDYMALGFIDTLKKQGFSVPKDLAVIGFDDIEAASFHNPPLTTIKQPVKKIFSQAAKIAIEICNGGNPASVIKFPSDLLIRSTCGCKHFLCDNIINQTISKKNAPMESIIEIIDSNLKQFLNANSARRMNPRIRSLLTFLQSKEVTKDNVSLILKKIESVIDEETYIYNSFLPWQKVLSSILSVYNNNIDPNCTEWKSLNLFENILLLINFKENLWCGNKKTQLLGDYTLPLRSLQQNMFNALTLQEKRSALISACENLEIENLHISLVITSSKKRGLYSTIEEESHLVFSYKNKTIQTESNPTCFKEFKTLDLLPKGSLNKPSGKSWFIAPLYNRDIIYGFITSD